MNNRLILFVLICLAATVIVICGIGCTSDEEKEVTVSLPPSSEKSQSDTQTTYMDFEKIPAVETPAKEISSTSANIQNVNADSADKTLPVEFSLGSKLWKTHTKSKPIFTHEKHFKVHKIACNECHHIYEDGKNIWKEGMTVDKCETCHNEPTIKNVKQLPPDLQKKNLKLAFHNNCKRCHKTLKKENPETKAPVTCNQCHPKQ